MDLLTSGLFWGALLVLIGLSIILKILFDLNIPIFRVAFALLLIYWGSNLLLGVSFKSKDKTMVFTDEKVKHDQDKKEYNTVFGKTILDLSTLSMKDTSAKTEVNVIFGTSDILIDDARPVSIKASSAFGSVSFPDETIITFGQRNYSTSTTATSKKPAEIELNVVFGNANIKRINTSQQKP